MKNHKKGFTLIEMLIVIAIIAIMVSIVIPTVSPAASKAKAATDAANLRVILGAMNAELLMNNHIAEEFIADMEPTKSKLFPDAKQYVVYTVPGIIDVYYVDDNNYYGLDYFSDVANNGSSDIPTSAPQIGSTDTWYIVGQGEITAPIG